MKIKIDENVPDGTYFTLSNVEPRISGHSLIIYQGQGTRRSWGRPGVDSSVVVNTATFTAIHVGYHHKHRGSQGWFYYLNAERVVWSSLNDKRRKQVLDNVAKAPGWTKCPGELRTSRRALQVRQTAYKAVQHCPNGLCSWYDPRITYTVGQIKCQSAKPDHEGGLYSFPTIDAAVLFAKKNVSPFVGWEILECQIWGKTITYDNGKQASTYLLPVRILEKTEYVTE